MSSTLGAAAGPARLRPRELAQRMPAEDFEALRTEVIALLRERRDQLVGQHRVRTGTGATRTLLLHGVVTERSPATAAPLRLRGLAVDVTERGPGNATEDRQRATRSFELSRVLLTLPRLEAPDSPRYLQLATEMAAMSIQADRISVWWNDEQSGGLVCMESYSASGHAHEQGSREVPGDHASLSGAIEHAIQDGLTTLPTYASPGDALDVGGPGQGRLLTLTAPMYLGGRLVGLARFERAGTGPAWSSEEVQFAQSFAGIVMHSVAQYDRMASQHVGAALFSHSPVGIAFLAADQTITLCNQRLEHMLGYASGELAGAPTAALHLDPLQQAQEAGFFHVPATGEARLRRKDGQPIWVDCHARPLVAGHPEAGALVTYTDITARKAAQQELLESERRFRSLTESFADWYWDQDEEFRFTRISLSSLATDPGFEEAPFIGRRRWELPLLGITPEKLAEHRAQVERHEPFRDLEYALRGPDGELHWTSVSGEPKRDDQGRVVGYRGVTKAITARKRQESDLALAKERLELALSASGQTVFDYDMLTGTVVHQVVSKTRRWRTHVHTMTLEEALRPVHPDDVGRVREAIAAALRDDVRLSECEFRARPRSGEWRWYRWNGRIVPNEDPTQGPRRITGTTVDITDLKRSEEALARLNRRLEASAELRAQALERSEARFRALFSEAPLGVGIADANLRFVTANPFFHKLVGQPLAGRTIENLVHPADWTRQAHLASQLTRGVIPSYAVECRCVRGDGGRAWVNLHAASVLDRHGAPTHTFLVVVVDISDRKAAEDQLRDYASQVSALSGRLLTAQEEERRHIARELHDEVGQVLTAVRLALRTAEPGTHAPGTDPFASAKAVIDNAIERVRKLSSDLRPPMLDDLGLLPALRTLCEQHRRFARMAVDFIVLGSDTGVPDALADTLYRLAQEGLTNVARHSRATRVEVRFGVRDGRIVLVIRDNGVGFQVGRRLPGLGILGMRERVKLHDGSLHVESVPGDGTDVTAQFRIGPAGAPPQSSGVTRPMRIA